jgi:ATP-dependent DNA helicase RecG
MRKLKDLLKEGESETVEFKPSLSQMDKITESISAFSNTKGGTVVIGVSDKGEVLGVDIGKNTIESLANQIKQNTDPMAYPSIRVEGSDKKQVVIIEIGEGKQKPLLAFGRAYRRVGRSNQKLGFEEIRNLAIETSKVHWDERICEDVSLDSIDREKLKWFLKDAKKQRGLNLPVDSPIKDALMKLKLLKNGNLTNAAVLLFCKDPIFLQSEAKCIRFSGNEPVKPYNDFQTIEGTVFDLMDRAMDFVLRNIRKSIRLVSGEVQREEKYEYPPDAIREAIVNAIAHRDYESPSKVQVRIFDNRIEIWNPGKLPDEITLDDLRRAHISVPRNPLLFKQLLWVKYVEDVGGGTLDMINQCKEWVIPEPMFEHVSGAFVVTFRLPPALKDLEKMGLNERQIRAMNSIVKKGSISNKEYISLNNVSRKTATTDLKRLVSDGLLIRIGEGKRNIEYRMPDYAKITQKITQKGS